MRMLQFADSFELPLTFVTSTQAILAKKRVGKSYTSDLQAEELLDAGQHIVIIDPTGAHWGLRSSADGERPGYPIAILGGDHADVPLEPTAGAEVAEAIVGDRFSAILDLSHMEIGEANRFVGDFLRRLYRLNRLPLHVFIDEADAFAPQTMQGDEMRTCGAVNTVVRRGGIKGIGVTLITQRPAVLSKSVLSQVDMLTCLRMHHTADLDQVEKWVGKHKKGTTAAEMIESLPSLPKGDAWVWNPEGDLFRRVKLRRKRTFDSGATPEPGAQVPAPRVLADIDLGKLGETIRDTMERARDSDPKALRDEVRRLRAELEKERAAPIVTKERELEIMRTGAEKAIKLLAGAVLEACGPEIAAVGKPLEPRPVTMEVRRPVAQPRDAVEHQLDELVDHTMPGVGAMAFSRASALPRVAGWSPRHVAILSSLRWWEEIGVAAPSATQVAFLTDYAPTSRGFKDPRGELKEKGMLEMAGDGTMQLTAQGRALAPRSPIPTKGAELRKVVLAKLPPRHVAILAPLIAAHPNAMSNEDLAQTTGYATTSRGFKDPRGELRTLGIVTYTRDGTRASDLLFPRAPAKR